MIIVIDNYDSFTYNLVQYLGVIDPEILVFKNDEITALEIKNLNPSSIIISPGPKTPDDAGICVELIKLASKRIPVLGICLGHQSIAQAYGGKVVKAKNIMHGKISNIRHNKKSLFKNMPQNFQATRYHSLIVEKKSLPKNILITSKSPDNYIMSIEIPRAKAYGLQFHPESYDTELGERLINNFINICKKQ